MYNILLNNYSYDYNCRNYYTLNFLKKKIYNYLPMINISIVILHKFKNINRGSTYYCTFSC
jgi:hypothetical protein